MNVSQNSRDPRTNSHEKPLKQANKQSTIHRPQRSHDCLGSLCGGAREERKGTVDGVGAQSDGYPILPCSVRSPSLFKMAVSILRVEFPDLLRLFFTPSSHLTISLMPWIWHRERRGQTGAVKEEAL